MLSFYYIKYPVRDTALAALHRSPNMRTQARWFLEAAAPHVSDTFSRQSCGSDPERERDRHFFFLKKNVVLQQSSTCTFPQFPLVHNLSILAPRTDKLSTSDRNLQCLWKLHVFFSLVMLVSLASDIATVCTILKDTDCISWDRSPDASFVKQAFRLCSSKPQIPHILTHHYTQAKIIYLWGCKTCVPVFIQASTHKGTDKKRGGESSFLCQSKVRASPAPQHAFHPLYNTILHLIKLRVLLYERSYLTYLLLDWRFQWGVCEPRQQISMNLEANYLKRTGTNLIHLIT